MIHFDIRILSFILITVAAFIIIALERLFPYNKSQPIIREGFWNDFVLYNFIQTFLVGIFIAYIIEFIDNSTNLSRIRLIAEWPIALQLLFFLVTHDLYIYWFHKLQHKNKYLWRLHEAHHSPKVVDWLSGVRSHSFEILINQTVEFLPIVLLGAPQEVAVLKGTISAIWGMFIHSNFNINLGFLKYLINGPEMHRWHHSISKGRNRNFATKLAIWDWLFNTAYAPINQKAMIYGLKTNYPSNYFNQLAFAFRKFSSKSKGIF